MFKESRWLSLSSSLSLSAYFSLTCAGAEEVDVLSETSFSNLARAADFSDSICED